MTENYTHLINVIFQSTGAQPTEEQIKRIKTALKGIAADAKPATDKMGDFERAIRRAVIVAPIWMAARAAMKETMQFIKEGFQLMIDMDQAMHNVASTFREIGLIGKESLGALQKGFHDLSMETGKSEVTIANAFTAVNRILQNTSESTIAVNEATKLSLETGADASKLAESMAFLYKLQGDSLTGLTSASQKFQEISTLLYITAAKTPGGIEKLTADIKNFSSTMNITDFGLENTIRLFGALESAGVSNAMALRTGLLKLLTDLDASSKMLGITFPENATSAEKFAAALTTLGTALKGTGDKGNTLKIIKDIFGGTIRGGMGLVSLAKDLKSIQEALSGAGTTGRERYLQEKQLELVTAGADHQIEVFKNLKVQLGETFISAITGADNFADAITRINETLTSDRAYGIRSWAEALGFVFNQVYRYTLGLGQEVDKFTNKERQLSPILQAQEDLHKRILLGLKGELSVADLVQLKAELLTTELITDETQRQSILDVLTNIAVKEVEVTKEKEKQNAATEESNLLSKKQVAEKEKELALLKKGRERQDIENKLNMAKALGIFTDSQLLEYQIKLVENSEDYLNNAQKTLKLEELRAQQELLIVQQTQKQAEAIENQYLAYEKADMFEKNRIRRLMELLTLSPTDLADTFFKKFYDKQIIIDYWNTFPEEAQKAINATMGKKYNLPMTNIKIGKELLGGEGKTTSLPNQLNVNQTASFGNIEINLPEGNLEDLLAKVREMLSDKLKNDEDFQRFIAGSIRPHI